VFGDLSDPTSRVAKLFEDNRAYSLLAELYTKPRNRFLSRVRNLNPAMSSAAASSKEGEH
jgi:molybdopterin-containing oxidoreductase family iron-sulfur binding subunit